jgi:hypothetical protein
VQYPAAVRARTVSIVVETSPYPNRETCVVEAVIAFGGVGLIAEWVRVAAAVDYGARAYVLRADF